MSNHAANAPPNVTTHLEHLDSEFLRTSARLRERLDGESPPVLVSIEGSFGIRIRELFGLAHSWWPYNNLLRENPLHQVHHGIAAGIQLLHYLQVRGWSLFSSRC